LQLAESKRAEMLVKSERRELKNMSFNSSDIQSFKNVWVFCEQRQGVMMPTTFELISEGRKLANELGVELCGILLGDNVKGIAAELGQYGADKVYVYDSPLLKDFTTDAYTKVIVEAVEELKPEVLLFGASNIGRDLAPRCAARLHTGLCADCTHLDIDMPNYKGFLKEASTLPEERIEKLGTVKIAGEDHDVSRDLKMTRPAFGGHLMASIICPRFRPAMATVRPGVMKKRECPKNVEIIEPKFELTAADIHTEVVDTVKAAKKLSDMLGCDLAIAHKGRPRHNAAEVMGIIGDIKGKTCIINDDMIDTAGTLCANVKELKAMGAGDIYVCATHGIFSGPAIERLNDAPIVECLVTDAIPVEVGGKIKTISVAEEFAQAISAVYHEEPVSTLVGGDFAL